MNMMKKIPFAFGLLPLCLWVFAVSANADTAQNLKQWISNAVDNHPSVILALSHVQSAKLNINVSSKPLYNPELGLNFESSASNTISVAYSQTLDWGNAQHQLAKRASLKKQAILLDWQTTRYEIANQLMQTLLSYQIAKQLSALLKEEQVLFKQSYQVAKKRFNAGDLAKVEVDFAGLSLSQANFRVANAIARLNEHKLRLFKLSGNNVGFNLALPQLKNKSKAELNNPLLIAQLPQIKAASKRVEVAQANINVQKVSNQANPTVGIKLGKEADDTLIGLSVSMALNIRNDYSENVSLASSKVSAAKNAYQVLFLQQSTQLELAAITYTLHKQTWQTWQLTGADTLNQQIKLLETLWTSGELKTTDYLIQLKQTLQTKADALEQKGKMLTSWLNWLNASGETANWLITGQNK